MNATDLVDRAHLRSDIPDFAPGDTLKVHVRVVEGNRQRTQLFQGVVIRRKGSGIRETFTVIPQQIDKPDARRQRMNVAAVQDTDARTIVLDVRHEAHEPLTFAVSARYPSVP